MITRRIRKPTMSFPHANILPYQGEVYYLPNVLTCQQCQYYFDALTQQILWQPDRIVMFGRTIVTKRHVAWYGDNRVTYRYAGSVKTANAWTDALRTLRDIVQKHYPSAYNSCLLNLYHHGKEGMGWHRDNEPEIIHQSPIASLSLGAARMMQFRHRTTRECIACVLEPGSLLIMQGACQQYWQHRIPIDARVVKPRINMTFRRVRASQ